MTAKLTKQEIFEKYSDFKTVPVSRELKCEITAIEVLKKLKKISTHCYMLESIEDTKEIRFTKQSFWVRRRIILHLQ